MLTIVIGKKVRLTKPVGILRKVGALVDSPSANSEDVGI